MKIPIHVTRRWYGVLSIFIAWFVSLVGLLFSTISHKNFYLLILLGGGISLLLAGLRKMHRRYQKVLEAIDQLASGRVTSPLAEHRQSPWAPSVNTLYHKLNEAASFIKELGNHDGANDLHYLQPTENLGQALLEVEQTLIVYREEERMRRWSAEGLAHFAEILRNNTDNIQGFCDQVIRELVKYLGCNQGSLFLEMDDEETSYLELQSCYAYDKKKYEQKRFARGQSLVGQCMLEQKPIILTEVPQSYVSITSGLGEATPGHVVIMPLLFQESAHGVIELASFKKLDKHQILFLEKVAESIASTLAMIRGNTHTKQLLINSQQLALELRDREEKTQQHLEELALAQQQMEGNQKELEGIFSAMDATLIVAYFNLEGNLLVANQNFTSLLGYTLEAVQSKDAVIFANSSQVSSIWENLSEGRAMKDDFQLLPLGESEVWVHASFTPITTVNGEIEKILMLGTDITQKKLVLEKLSLVANNTDNSVIITGKDGRVEYVNKGFVNLTGYSTEEVLGRNPDSFLHGPKTDRETVNRIRQKHKEGVSFHEEILNYKKNGESFWVSIMMNPVCNEAGEVDRFVTMQPDVTKIKEDTLDYTYKLEAISKSNAVVEFDSRGFVVDANSMYLEITGYQKEELVGRLYSHLIPKSEMEKPQTQMMWENLKAGTFFSGEFKQKSKQGKELWLSGTFNPIFDLDNQLQKIMMFAQFTTREKETQQELMGTIQALMNAVMTIEMDVDGNLKKANARFLEAFGYKRLEIARKTLSDILAEGCTVPKVSEILKDSEAKEYPLTLITKVGEVHHYRGTFAEVRDMEGTLLKVVLVLLEEAH